MPWRPEDRGTGATYGTAWRRARKTQLERDSYRCQLQLPGCTHRATTVDHITQAANDPAHRHLRSLCESCHRKVTAQQGGGWRRGTAQDPDPQPRTAW